MARCWACEVSRPRTSEELLHLGNQVDVLGRVGGDSARQDIRVAANVPVWASGVGERCGERCGPSV